MSRRRPWLVGGNVTAVTVSGPIVEAATVGELIGSLGSWVGADPVSGRTRSTSENRCAARCAWLMVPTSVPWPSTTGMPLMKVDRSTMSAASRDAPGVEDDRVGGHHVRD